MEGKVAGKQPGDAVKNRHLKPVAGSRTLCVAGSLLFLFCLLQCARANAQSRKPEPASRGASIQIPPEAARHFDAAKIAEAREDWRTAENEYHEPLKRAPDWPEATVQPGLVYHPS